MPSPEVLDIGGQVNDARFYAKGIALNLKRELHNYDLTLELFSQTPTGTNSLLSLTQDFCCLRKPDNANFPEYPFELTVLASATTSGIMNLVSTFTLGTDKFRVLGEQSPVCNFGVWKLRAVEI